jgi:L-ascorbate metabolism protein UlaG (beta-lactamase superfamily)
MNENVHADVVTVSHNHFDHNDFSHITGGHQLIDTAGSFNVQGIEIKGIAGHHNKGDNLTTNIIYVFNVDGLRCAQFASQGDLLTEEMYNEIGVIDILIIQICEKGKKKLIAETAAAIAQRLQAKIIIPAHGDVSQTDAFAAFLGADVEQNSTGKILVEKKSLAALQTPRVIVLDLP